MPFRSGFVALCGRPNVGKSTLLNRVVGQKIAITSSVAQTTRHRIKGVVTSDKGQVIFFDTPGFSKALDKLGEYLTTEGEAAIEEADAYVMVVDGGVIPGRGDEWVASMLIKKVLAEDKFLLCVVNKMDLLKDPEKRERHLSAYKHLLKDVPDAQVQVVLASALTGKHVDTITETLVRKMPEGPKYYDEDAVTDQRMREMTAEIIREKVMRNTREEIPHSVAIAINTFIEPNTGENQKDLTRISATLFVDQESQKGILVGKAGSMIKQLGIEARKDIETMVEGKVHLELQVRLKKNWRKDREFLKSLGLAPPEN